MANECIERDIAAEIEAKAAALGLTANWAFVPFSQSRNKDEKHPSLNWIYTLRRNGQEIMTGDYMQGYGRCPAYKASIKELGGRDCVMRDEAIRAECETGKRSRLPGTFDTLTKLPTPSMADLIASLCLDSSAIDARNFEDWALDHGYDTDSRKGEALYRQCLEIALTLRAAVGDSELSALRELAQAY